MAIIDIQDSNMTSEKRAISFLSNSVTEDINFLSSLKTALESVWKDSAGTVKRSEMQDKFDKLKAFSEEANVKSQNYMSQIIDELNIYVSK